jgi:hypothetical protein
MLNLETVKQDIERWIINFVEVKNPALSGWPPCPYARKARLERDYNVCLGLAPMHDLIQISQRGLGGKSVVVIAYEASYVGHEELSLAISTANKHFLLPNDLLALEDHPADPEIVNGVPMNQGTYALALVQGLSDLNTKAKIMSAKGFYDSWPEEYLEALFQHREDPRQ